MSAGAVLCAHKDTTRVSEAIVRAVPAPVSTETWKPYTHGAVLDALGAAAEGIGLQICRTDYSLNKSLTRLFGVWEVARRGTDEINLALGLRNSLDKHFAVGLCAGERVFVCDNLVFASEFVLFRRHSGTLIEEELIMIAREAILTVLPQFEDLKAWHESLKTVPLKASQAAILTLAAMKRDILPPSHYPAFHGLFYGEGSKYSKDLWGWHGAVTEVYKDLSLLSVQYRNADLNRFIRFEAPRYLNGRDEYLNPDTVLALAEKASKKKEDRTKAECRETAAEIKRRVKHDLKDPVKTEDAARAVKAYRRKGNFAARIIRANRQRNAHVKLLTAAKKRRRS